MYAPARSAPFTRTVPQLQIIIVGLLVGFLAFLAVAAYVVQSGEIACDPREVRAMTLMCLVATAMIVVGYLVTSAMLAVLLRKMRQRCSKQPYGAAPEEGVTDRDRLWRFYFVSTIAGAGLLHSGALFCVVGYMVTQALIPLVLGAALVLGVALKIPTQSRVDAWLDEQLRLLREERQLAGR